MATETEDPTLLSNEQPTPLIQLSSNPNYANLLLSLPPELIDAIIDHLPALSDLQSLILTCTAFHDRYRLRLVVKVLQDSPWVDVVFCLAGAEDGEFGWKPFTIMKAQIGVAELTGRDLFDYVSLTCVEYNIAEFRPETPTREYLIIDMTYLHVYADEDYLEWLHTAPKVVQDWDSVSRGRLQRVTPELVRERFGPCPECNGNERVEFGSVEFAQR